MTETTFENIEQVYSIINDDSYITIEELHEQTSLSFGIVHRIIGNSLECLLENVLIENVPQKRCLVV